MRRADRILVAVIAVYQVFAGWRMFALHETGTVAFAAILPWVYIAAGVLCMVLQAAFRNRTLFALAGALSVVSSVARALLLLVAMEQGRLEITDARAQLGVATWGVLGVLLGYVWLHVLRPIAEWRRASASRP